MTEHKIKFMSAEHVAAMNELLRDAPEVRDVCSVLDREHVMAYRLTGGPDGRDVLWSVIFGDTVQFELRDDDAPDVLLVGDWGAMIRTLHDARSGSATSPDLTLTAEPEVFARLNAIFDIARPVAMVDTALPDLPA